MKQLFLLSIILILFSCVKNDEKEIDYSLTVGNIYCSDGSVINPNSYNESGKIAVGVVFWVNTGDDNITDKALAVGLEDLTPAFWADSLVNISNVSTDLIVFNGASNTASIVSWGMTEVRQTPAAINTYNYSKSGVVGWFIPSIGEAKSLCAAKNTVYHSFAICKGKYFENDWYWTSTQDGSGNDNAKLNALAISLKEGAATTSEKLNVFPVRPIISIK